MRKVDDFFTNENQRFSDFRELPNLGLLPRDLDRDPAGGMALASDGWIFEDGGTPCELQAKHQHYKKMDTS